MKHTHIRSAWRRWRRSSLSWCSATRFRSPRWSSCWKWSTMPSRICPRCWVLIPGYSCCAASPDEPRARAASRWSGSAPRFRWRTRCRPANERSEQRCTWAGRERPRRIQSNGPVFAPLGRVVKDVPSWAGRWGWSSGERGYREHTLFHF